MAFMAHGSTCMAELQPCGLRHKEEPMDRSMLQSGKVLMLLLAQYSTQQWIAVGWTGSISADIRPAQLQPGEN
ncbi:hypothetical protein VCV18_009693 [Metarhizium anisopliae]